MDTVYATITVKVSHVYRIFYGIIPKRGELEIRSIRHEQTPLAVHKIISAVAVEIYDTPRISPSGHGPAATVNEFTSR